MYFLLNATQIIWSITNIKKYERIFIVPLLKDLMFGDSNLNDAAVDLMEEIECEIVDYSPIP